MTSALESLHFRPAGLSWGTREPPCRLRSSRPLLIPPKSILREFLETAAPFHAQMEKLGELNSKLRAARDLLLPRLMNGEIAV